MNISIPKVSFGRDFVYKDRYIPDKQDVTFDVLRASLEEKMGPNFFYLEQIKKEKDIPSARFLKLNDRQNSAKDISSKQTKVDTKLLESLGIYALSQRRKNELYSGEQLLNKVDKLEGLKNAGIKSVFSLAPSEEYKKQVESCGLNYSSLSQLGLSIFDINGDLIHSLVRNPENYSNDVEDKKLQGLKEFIKILNGKNPNMPLPIYFGCHYGTDRTFMWYSLYKILKDEDMSKSLYPDVVEKLAEFAQNVDDYFRW